MRCRVGFGARRSPSDRVWRALAALLTNKSCVPPSPFRRLRCWQKLLAIPFILSPCNLPFASRLASCGASAPRPLARCANHLFLRHPQLRTCPAAPSILPRSTPLSWPPVPIRSPLDHTSLVGGPGPHHDVDDVPGCPCRWLPACSCIGTEVCVRATLLAAFGTNAPILADFCDNCRCLQRDLPTNTLLPWHGFLPGASNPSSIKH